MNSNQQSGRALVGFAVGLVVGTVIAAIAAVLVTKAPVPFLNKVQRPTDTVRPSADGKLPDPNTPLYTPPIAKPDLSAPAAPQIDPPVLPPPQAKIETQTETEATRYLLQAGAFKAANEADSMRARLAMIGLDARIYPIEQAGATLYRVRIGPYGQIDEVNKARKLLAENNIDAQVVRVR